MESSFAEHLWAYAIIGGPILLGIILALGVIYSRRRRHRPGMED
jgi:hypothetical protein